MMKVTIELDIPVCRGDFTQTPEVVINCYDSTDKTCDDKLVYQQGTEFADFIYSQCKCGFYKGLFDRLKELNIDEDE
jgi:hypothetical protein